MTDEYIENSRTAHEDLAEHLESLMGDYTDSIKMDRGELILVTSPKNIVPLLQFLRDDGACLFKILLDICGVDWPGREKRFEVVYNLLSMKHNLRVRVKVSVEEGGLLPTVVDLFSTAGWFERETYDMYGVLFDGNPDLRRILTDYGFQGHPLRKDFPLTGFVEVRYDDSQKRVVYEPIKLTQEYRSFDNLSPWQGPNLQDVTAVLPGDEKATGEQA